MTPYDNGADINPGVVTVIPSPVVPRPLSPLISCPVWLVKLMQRSKLNMNWKITAEERECIKFADRMRSLTLDRKYQGIWFHAANEGKRHLITALIMKAMGMIAGTPDFVFIGPWGNGLIEFKAPELRGRSPKTGKDIILRAGGQQSEYQAYFQLWAAEGNVAYVVCTSVDEAIAVLREWGAIP